MKLKLHRVIGYNGHEPVLGSVIATFTGNQKTCTSQAKRWIKENPQPTQPAYKWDS
jgi:hypothetical protein